MVANYIRIIAGAALVSAGAIHSFPSLWHRWDEFLLENPGYHWVIGGAALSIGILNLAVTLVDWYRSSVE